MEREIALVQLKELIGRDLFSCAAEYGVIKDSVILLEQIRTIDKSRLKEKVCHLDKKILKRIDKALEISLALDT